MDLKQDKWHETQKLLDDVLYESLHQGGRYLPKKRCFKSAGEINLRLRAIHAAMREYETTPIGMENGSDCPTICFDGYKRAQYPQPIPLEFSEDLDLDLDEV